MKLSRLLLPALLAASPVVAGAAHAQQAPVTFGQRVRLTTATGATRGTVVRVDTAGVLVNPAGTDTVFTAWRDVERVEVSRGASPGMTGLRYGGIGLVAGAAGGALLGYTTYDGDDGDWCLPFCTRRDAALFSGTLLGILGGGVGFVTGVLLPRERWRPAGMPVGVSVSPAPGSGVTVAGQIRF